MERSEDSSASDLPRIRWGRHFELHPVVFPAAAGLILALLILCFSVPSPWLKTALVDLRDAVGRGFGWLYIAAMSGWLALAVWLACGRFAHVKLGQDDEFPEFSRLAWFSMLFSAGMGIGLLFFSVAEPAAHWRSPPPGFAEGLNASRIAMAVTIFHWGLHPWALYAVVALALAYFGFRRGLPLSFRSLLHPLLGNRVGGRWGDLVDTLAILSTLTGVATSLGIGAQQVNAGLTFLFGAPSGVGVQILLIAGITAVATLSVVLGLDAGIRRLSEWNMALAGGLLLLVVFGGGLVAYLGAAVENLGAYLQIMPFHSLRTGAFSREGKTWLNAWTVFYWAWWISWSPFVGMFIARVSRGRTIREFIVGVLLVPTAVGLAWLTAFGTATLRQHTRHQERLATDASYSPHEALPSYWVAEVGDDGRPIRLESGEFQRSRRPLTAVQLLQSPLVSADGSSRIEQTPVVLFALLQGLLQGTGLAAPAAAVATVCIILFFVTSSDSASMVIDIIASGGNPNPPVGTRLFWAITEGLTAVALLTAGGLDALQAASITMALPLTMILILAAGGLLTSLVRHESPAAIAGPPAATQRSGE